MIESYLAGKCLADEAPSKVPGSFESRPDTMLSILAISHANFAKMPGESKEVEDGNMPARVSNPVEILKPY